MTEKDSKKPLSEEAQSTKAPLPKEIGGQKGPDPVRFGDWENKGRCTDF